MASLINQVDAALLFDEPRLFDRVRRVQATPRDLQIFKFIRNMKFGYAPILQERFFPGGTRNERLVRNRLSKLKRGGLLTSVYHPNGRELLYLLSREGERQLCRHLDETLPRKYAHEFEPRLFDHDLKVMKARAALEKSGRARNWIAEREVKQTVTAFQGLPRKYMPDAIYENKSNDLVAFEMEIAPKTIQRYQEKIDKYVVLFRSHFNTPVRFARALFVCEKESVYRRLRDMTRPHGGLFYVQRFKDLTLHRHSQIKPPEEKI